MADSITFCGAARTVTGSKHLIETNGKKILVDCGLFQGSRALSKKNWDDWAFDPRELDAVVITHAHLDHIGMLPRLIRDGYNGPIYATSSTIGIATISLPDSGRIQEEDARYHNRHKTSSHTPALPLYTEGDAFNAIKLFKPIRYNTLTPLPGGAQFQFIQAGHILGSAFAQVYFESGKQILMGGDLGRYDAPIINDPQSVDFAEYLVLESTYGDRLHTTVDAEATLLEIFEDVYANSRRLIIPSFAIGRTQELLYFISRLQQKGKMPRIPIYVDSPMATSATRVYDKNTDEYDVDMKDMVDAGTEPLSPEGLVFIRDSNASKELNVHPGPMMIIAGSGMCNGGRVVHHLKHRLSDPSTVVLFSGYQGHGTLGRQILDGAEEVMIHGEPITVRAEVKSLTALSAHADQGEIFRWLKGFKTPPVKTFIVHGEPEVQDVLAAKIRQDLGWNVEIPEEGYRAPL